MDKSRSQMRVPEGSGWLKAPSQYGVDVEGRSNRTSIERAHMQNAQTPQELLHKLGAAVASGRIDASVFGAAAKRCGQGRWWDCISDVRRFQKVAKLTLFAIQRNQFIWALGECISSSGTICHDLAIDMGKQIWSESSSATDSVTFNSGLSSAFRLCSVSEAGKALEWADELWHWACEQDLVINAFSHSLYVRVLDAHGLHDRVEVEITAACEKAKSDARWTPSRALLGALVKKAGERFDIERVDCLWNRWVVDFGVVPEIIEYACLIKAYLRCGRPAQAVQSIDEMCDKGFALEPIQALDLVQAHICLYHSSLTKPELKRLNQAIQKCESIVFTKHQEATLSRLLAIAHRLRQNPQTVKFHDLLVLKREARESVMAKWTRCVAGSKYFK